MLATSRKSEAEQSDFVTPRRTAPCLVRRARATIEYRVDGKLRQPTPGDLLHSAAMSTERPFLTAQWRDLLLLNFVVPADLIARSAPPGTEPDLFEGLAYISVVGFRFDEVRLCGLPVPGHTCFSEINLRYYVRRTVAGEVRRGVVFVREIVPLRTVALVANWLFNENYVTRPMHRKRQLATTQLAAGDEVEYGWQDEPTLRGRAHRDSSNQPRWNRLAARLAAAPALPRPGSLDKFIIEHYWGYARGRDGHTREYRVQHVPWRVAPVERVEWDCEASTTYDSPWAEYLATQPASALIADGSAVQVFRSQRL